jgi:hypothetical protein
MQLHHLLKDVYLYWYLTTWDRALEELIGHMATQEIPFLV